MSAHALSGIRLRGLWSLIGAALCGLGSGACGGGAPASPPAPEGATSGRARFAHGERALFVEVLDDDVVRLELAASGGERAAPSPSSPMVLDRSFPGPRVFERTGESGEILRTGALEIAVAPSSLCVSIRRRESGRALSTLCPAMPESGGAGIAVSAGAKVTAYGLGQAFSEPGRGGDWVGRSRSPGGRHGNAMVPFDGGHAGDTQIPILYVVDQTGATLGLFVDEVAPLRWDLAARPWRVRSPEPRLRAYVLAGPDPAEVRSDFLELVGRPPVPPKKMFGLWVSEYGFDSWKELEDKLSTLRARGFPVDGFVLDLQWFGGIRAGSDETQMGSLTWDEKAFPRPAETIARLRDEEAIGLMVIEESYVGRALAEHRRLARAGYLVRRCEGCKPLYLEENPWWGKGGMIDWTHPEASAFWHDEKRQPLIELGVLGHWTDLGEPEQYGAGAWYHGGGAGGRHDHASVHNLYNFLWSQSIYRGYRRHQSARRPFILSRSGTAGSQRFGVALWSGDVAARLSSLAAHLDAQTGVWLSGIDYYGADIGGFKREAVRGDPDAMYTRWLAAGAAFDVPVRPHALNLCNCRETAPDRIGDTASNLANLRLRYALIPYLYSLAHRAHRTGEAVFSPLVYRYPRDPNVRRLGRQKLVGDLLVAAVTDASAREVDVYLPPGRWANYHTRDVFESEGEWLRGVPLELEGTFRLPVFAPAGAIVPQMHVDAQTLDATGRRADGSIRDDLVVSVVPAPEPTRFTLYEDDGETTAYLRGEVRTTEISQVQRGDRITVEVSGAEGDYEGARARRATAVRLFVGERAVAAVSLDGEALPQLDTATRDRAARGWLARDGLVVARSGRLDVRTPKRFVVRLRPLTSGASQ